MAQNVSYTSITISNRLSTYQISYLGKNSITISNIVLFGLNAKKKYGIVHIDNSKEKIEEVKKIINPEFSLNINALTFLNYMNFQTKIEPKKLVFWQLYIQTLKKSYENTPEKDMTIPYIVNQLSKKLEKESEYIITTGVGSHMMDTAQYFTWKHPKTLLASGSLGTMGVGVHFATGAQIANPDKLVICIDGDGSFLMSLDLLTIAENKIPIKIIIMDNCGLQMVKNWQEIFYENRYIAAHLKNPHFVKLANSMGIKAISCDNVNDIDICLNFITYFDGPLLVHFKVKEQQTFPFVKPGAALDDITLE
jgi:acetolactate synthase-1/2/3 large subunit